MKPNTLLSLLATAAAAHADPTSSISSSTAVATELTDGKGTVTITVEKDGKKETRTIVIDGPADFQTLTDQISEKLGAGTHATPAAPTQKVTYLGVMLSEPSGSSFGAGGGLAGSGGGFIGGAPAAPGGAPAADVAPTAPGLPPGTGLTVTGVTTGSPAEKAGLQGGDVLARLNDQILVNSAQFTTLVRTMKEGDVVKIAFIRNGEPKNVEATLASRTEELAPAFFGDLHHAGSMGPDLNIHRMLRSDGLKLGRVLTLDPQGNVVESTPGSLVPPPPPLAPGAPAPPPPPPINPNAPETKPLALDELRPAWETALREAAAAKDKAASQWQEQLAKWRADWTENQKKATDEYRKAMEKMSEEVAKAREATQKAREEARRAVEDIMRKIEDEKAKSAPAPEPKPEPAEPEPPKNA